MGANSFPGSVSILVKVRVKFAEILIVFVQIGFKVEKVEDFLIRTGRLFCLIHSSTYFPC